MGLKARILKVTSLASGGPRNRNVLRSLARTPVQAEQFDRIFNTMLASGELVKYSPTRGRSEKCRGEALYGPPGLTRRRGEWVEPARSTV